MDAWGVRGMPPQASRTYGAGGPVLDLVASKLSRPVIRRGTVRRSSLIEWLARGEDGSYGSAVASFGGGTGWSASMWSRSSWTGPRRGRA